MHKKGSSAFKCILKSFEFPDEVNVYSLKLNLEYKSKDIDYYFLVANKTS